MSIYSVNRNLTHDGEKYVKGDAVEMAEEQAENLLILGVIRPVGKRKKSSKGGK